MGVRNTSLEYGAVAKLLHWLVAIGIFVLIWLGLEQSGLERGPRRDEIRFIHASIALAVFVLMSIRILWRFMNEVPAHPAGMPEIQKIVAGLVHWGLYVAIFIQLVSGAMMVATDGNPLPFFGLFSVPLPVPDNHDAHEVLEEVHEIAWIAVAVLIGVHVLGALYNHFVARNDVLRRMTRGVNQVTR